MGRRGPLGLVILAAVFLVGFHSTSAVARFNAGRLDRELRSEPGLFAVLVVQHDRLIFERYYRGAQREAPLDVFSVTKAVTSTLVGIALREHKLATLDEQLGRFFPNEVRAAPDKRVRRITIRELLTMTAGYSGTPAIRTDQWLETLIRRPLQNHPGRAFAYDDGSYHLLSAVLTRATGMTADAYARRTLFRTLGIRNVGWPTDGEGNSRGDTGLRLRGRDLLRIGELYLHGGRWHGKRLLAMAYVRAATRREDAAAPYGYGWWVRPHHFAALGFGGQEIAVFPRLAAVVVIQGNDDDREKILNRLVLPELMIR
jgi:CubicO group peptidase (beta-lactamase class C family)